MNTIVSFLVRIQTNVLAHKVIAGAVIVVLLAGGYFEYKKLTSTAGVTRYTLAVVSKGTIISSVGASGQVSTSNQLDIKPKASGDIVSVPVVAGQSVQAGQIIAVLDTTDAQKAVRDAQNNLDSAKLSLQKTQAPADTLSLTQAKNALAQAQDDLVKAYDTGFSNITDTFVDLPSVMAGLDDILYGTEVNPITGQPNIAAYTEKVRGFDDTAASRRTDVEAKYNAARVAYEKTSLDYKAASRLSDKATIEKLLQETYDTSKLISDSVNASNSFLSFVHDRMSDHDLNPPSQLATQQTTLGTYTNTINGHLSDLSGNLNSITTGNRSIDEKTQSLSKLQAGADPLDVQSGQLTLKQREDALADAKANLADYYVRTPLAGTIASLTAKKYDTAGSGTALATIITKQKIAEISLNEVDAAKIKAGNKVSLSFDAIDGLTLTGQVASVDTVGTVSQGVVSYSVKISFDSQDDRIKSGMTVNAVITDEAHQNALMVPSSAVKTVNGVSMVQVFDPALPASDATAQGGVISATLPRSIEVETGISDDTNVEILSGLTEGQQIVTRTTVGTATASTATTGARTGATRTNAGFGGGAQAGIRL